MKPRIAREFKGASRTSRGQTAPAGACSPGVGQGYLLAAMKARRDAKGTYFFLVVGTVIGLALGILVSLTTDVPFAPEAGLVLGALVGWGPRKGRGLTRSACQGHQCPAGVKLVELRRGGPDGRVSVQARDVEGVAADPSTLESIVPT
jgi:hypothetical protein